MSIPQPYPDYRSSGRDWLGDVPVHWELTPLKHMCRFSGGGTPSKETARYWTDGYIPWVSPKDMKSARIVDSLDHVTAEAVEESSTGFVAPGALLMVVRSGILQRTIPVAINDVRVTLNQDMKALAFRARNGAEYFSYLVQGHASALRTRWLKEGATVESVEHAYLANDLVPNLDAGEMGKIVGFLDYETARIDALIEKQQQLIALLKEKRQAVISHAVTKGLNPNAPLRDSGVEWLGMVPAHWEVLPIRHALRIDNGPRLPINREERAKIPGPYPYWGPTGVFDHIDHFRYEGERAIIGEDGDHFLKFAIWPMTRWASGKFNVNNHAHVVATGAKCSARWFYYSFLHRDLGGDVIAQGVSRLKLTREGLSKLILAVPPLDEQLALLAHVEPVIAKVEAATAKAERQIELLQERRTALISAAVTGKIDVRNWTPPQKTNPQGADPDSHPARP